MSEMVVMAKAKNDAQFAHECALIALLGNALSSSPRPADAFNPWRESEHG